jgi:hypothetical protein
MGDGGRARKQRDQGERAAVHHSLIWAGRALKPPSMATIAAVVQLERASSTTFSVFAGSQAWGVTFTG